MGLAGLPRLPAPGRVGLMESGPLGPCPTPEFFCRPSVWAGGWGASDSGSFLLLHFPTHPPSQGEKGRDGRAEEGCLARPPVQPGLGTLPEELRQCGAWGLAWPEVARRGQEQCPLHSQSWPRSSGPQHHPHSWAPCPVPGYCPPTPWQLPAMPSSQKASLLPSLILTPRDESVCVWMCLVCLSV